MFRLKVKQNGTTEELFARENELMVEAQYQGYLTYAESEGWAVTTLNNGKTMLKRGDDKMVIWIESPAGEVVR